MAKQTDEELDLGFNHLCEGCYEIRRGFLTLDSGKKICRSCGGTVLSLQEAADRIAELKEELAALEYTIGQ